MSNSLRQRVMSLVGKKESHDAAVQTFTIIMRRFKISRSELMDTPVPAYNQMIKILIKEQKEAEKDSKSGKKPMKGMGSLGMRRR